MKFGIKPYWKRLKRLQSPIVEKKNEMDAFKKSKVKKWINIYNLVGMELNYI